MSVTKKIEEFVIEGVTYVPKDLTQPVIVKELNGEESVFELGKNYLIRTVTMFQLGKLKRITNRELVLEQACWVADTGRFSVALRSGILNEVEMFTNDVIVNRDAIVDATIWSHDLPKVSK